MSDLTSNEAQGKGGESVIQQMPSCFMGSLKVLFAIVMCLSLVAAAFHGIGYAFAKMHEFIMYLLPLESDRAVSLFLLGSGVITLLVGATTLSVTRNLEIYKRETPITAAENKLMRCLSFFVMIASIVVFSSVLQHRNGVADFDAFVQSGGSLIAFFGLLVSVISFILGLITVLWFGLHYSKYENKLKK